MVFKLTVSEMVALEEETTEIVAVSLIVLLPLNAVAGILTEAVTVFCSLTPNTTLEGEMFVVHALFVAAKVKVSEMLPVFDSCNV